MLAHEWIDDHLLILLDVYVGNVEHRPVQAGHGTLEVLHDGMLHCEVW